MVTASAMERGPFDPLENDRITKLGRILRKSRIDELPQIINVLRGDMSLIGPRPDALSHASVYLLEIPGYRVAILFVQASAAMLRSWSDMWLGWTALTERSRQITITSGTHPSGSIRGLPGVPSPLF